MFGLLVNYSSMDNWHTWTSYCGMPSPFSYEKNELEIQFLHVQKMHWSIILLFKMPKIIFDKILLFLCIKHAGNVWPPFFSPKKNWLCIPLDVAVFFITVHEWYHYPGSGCILFLNRVNKICNQKVLTF